MRGFPVRLVEHFHPRSGTWRGRRGKGRVQATGLLRLGSRPFSGVHLSVPEDAGDDALLMARLCERALLLAPRRWGGGQRYRDLCSGLAGAEFSVGFVVGHDLLLDLGDLHWDILVACDVASPLGIGLDPAKKDLQANAPDTLRGLEILLALGQLHLFELMAGHSQRSCLHWLLDLYGDLSRGERLHLHQLLEGTSLDSGNLFSQVLKRASSVPETGDHDHLKWRDRQVTWLLGQDRLDLPYNRQAAADILQSDGIDLDEKRFLLYGLLRDYSRDLEGGNIQRLSREARRAGQLLIFGRMSRAFHNQGTLFADACMLTPGDGWPLLAADLAESVGGSPPLETAVEELRQLLDSDREIPLIQLEGACERFEETVLEEQKRDLLTLLRQSRNRVEDYGDELADTEPPASAADSEAMAAARHRLKLVERVRDEILSAEGRPAAYVVISQRPSPTGSHLLIKINEFQEPYLGKSANLRKLVRLAGDRLYSSPDYRWLEVADHWIEAIPLFIKEEVRVSDGRETTHTVIDIAGMEESFREEMADHWARNIKSVLEAEFLAVARLIIAADGESSWSSLGEREALESLLDDGDDDDGGDEVGDEVDGRHLADSGADDVPTAVSLLALVVEEVHGILIGDIQRLVELEELEPFQALLRALSSASELPEPLRRAVDAGRHSGSWLDGARRALGAPPDADRLADLRVRALEPRRPLPTLHVLTTQSAGMTDGYIRTWLEESMALYNVVSAHGLEDEVAARRSFFESRIAALGEKVIRELGIWVEVEEIGAAEQIPLAAAVHRIVQRNRSVSRELSVLGTLLEVDESRHGRAAADAVDDPAAVDHLLGERREELRQAALRQVADRNGEQLRVDVAEYLDSHPEVGEERALRQVVEADAHYRQDLDAFARFQARTRLLAEISEGGGQDVDDRAATFLRRFQRLANTTARKEIVAERGLAAQSLDPLHYYQATGAGKRYHLLYTPSRVDLGHRERESVETWAQWVGGADRAAARTGRQVYGLINKSVRSYQSLTEPEVLKTGENASMASHFAFSNALSLMVTACGHGDIEEMGDQMSRRGDRLVHPAGEGYGGYCVPKDGLFLEFVLTLSRTEKLRQLGVPGDLHDGVARLAVELLDRRDDFETRFEWESWAASRLGDQEALRPYFSAVDIDDASSFGETSSPLPVFQITRLAHVLENLGQPEIQDHHRVTSTLVARWGIHKMVAGGEHVNRFMPFFKTWLLRQAVAEAARRHPHLGIPLDRFTVVLTAEYKPDTQDGRFSVGMRKFEILAGSGQHLLYALDADGQELAGLITEGYDALVARGKGEGILRTLGIDPGDGAAVDRVRKLFGSRQLPAAIRVVSPSGLSTQDLLSYTSDTDLEARADEAMRQLLAAGLSESEVEANVETFGIALGKWAHQADLSGSDKEALVDRLGGALHALALRIVGPERSYERALEGADILDTGVPHQVLLDLLDRPATVCHLMLEGNPRSALAIVDGASGARRRAMNRMDVMLWFASGERLGREPVYAGIGLGAETVEGWRLAMRRLRRRAKRLGDALADRLPTEAEAIYAQIVEEIRQEQEVQLHLDEIEKLRRFGRDRPRDEIVGRALARVSRGLPLGHMRFSDFLALGGIFLLDGADGAEIAAYRRSLEAGLAAVRGSEIDRSPEEGERIALLARPVKRLQVEEFREEKGVESSNKAAEERPLVALEARRQLADRIVRARALNERQAAYERVDADAIAFDDTRRAAMAALGRGDEVIRDGVFGTFMGYTRNALLALVSQLYDEEFQEQAQGFISRISQLFIGRQIDLDVWREIAGGYEDIGDFGRLAQSIAESETMSASEVERRLRIVAQGAELFYILLALETTVPLTRDGVARREDSSPLWCALADFFAETIDDHFYEYRPWVYSRGVGFARYEGESLYALAVEFHSWLYRYLRFVVTSFTEVRELPADEQDLLLGNFLDGTEVEAIGGGGSSAAEQIWRSYGQLRELAFIRNDGFPLPMVFPSFDTKLIDAAGRVNHVIALPVGRTHYSRALCEGPTLARQLVERGRPGANVMISRRVRSAEERGRRVVYVDNAHLYIAGETCVEALVRCKGMRRDEAQQLLAGAHAKGIRIAAQFDEPILAALVYPFHGDPLYTSGQLEDCGLPYTVQSLFHTWTTYDKAKYPDIFPADSGVDTPAEIDWLASWTSRARGEAQAREWIENGLDDRIDFPGLRAFASQHRLVMIKDAAESGGRNAAAFLLCPAGAVGGGFDEAELERAVDFVFQISLRHNVSIQEVIRTSPEYWATREFMDAFVRRQITEWGSPVERRRRPRSPIYGSVRIIMSCEDPGEADLDAKWHISHWIALTSKQLITNVGRGGTLEELRPEFIRAEHRAAILDKLAAAGRAVMEALAAYEAKAVDAYTAETGRDVGCDLTGLSYGVPRYMMLDFLIAPVFAEPGAVVDVVPAGDDESEGCGEPEFILQRDTETYSGTIADWRIVLIEPNIGVGLWDRLAIREAVHEDEASRAQNRDVDWDQIGRNARVVLSDLSRAGEEYLAALRGDGAGPR